MGSGLKLIALDDEDLAVLSVHLQDAVVTVGDMTFQPGDHRFVMLASRFDWETAVQKELLAEGAGAGEGSGPLDLGPSGKAPSGCVRRRAGIRFEHVLAARVRGIDLKRKRDVLNLLLVTFEPSNSPSGTVTFTFSGGGQLQLTVDCLEAGVEDLGPAWDAKGTPCHDA